MFTELQKQRMEMAKSTSSETNCMGTALYVLGVLDNDTYVGAGEKRWESGIVDDLLKKSTKIDKPQEGAVLVFRNHCVEHLGIIVNEEPPTVYHRPGYNRPIDPNAPLTEVILSYSHIPLIEFYMPQQL